MDWNASIIMIHDVFWSRRGPRPIDYIGCNRKYVYVGGGNLTDGELCIEKVHPGSDSTSRSVAWNQVPRHKSEL